MGKNQKSYCLKVTPNGIERVEEKQFSNNANVYFNGNYDDLGDKPVLVTYKGIPLPMYYNNVEEFKADFPYYIQAFCLEETQAYGEFAKVSEYREDNKDDVTAKQYSYLLYLDFRMNLSNGKISHPVLKDVCTNFKDLVANKEKLPRAMWFHCTALTQTPFSRAEKEMINRHFNAKRWVSYE